MVNKIDLSMELGQAQTLLNCLESALIRATAGNVSDDTREAFDLLGLLMDHVERMSAKHKEAWAA